jgi:hypothetical protein
MNPLNSPLEVGIRALVLLSQTFPQRLDVAQLVYLDHAMVHSGDLRGGPDSLHPDLPVGPGELGMRRHLIEQGLVVLMRAGLAEVIVERGGLLYQATEESESFLAIMEAPYLNELKDRAAWLVAAHMHEGSNVRAGMKLITQRWAEHLGPSEDDPRQGGRQAQ